MVREQVESDDIHGMSISRVWDEEKAQKTEKEADVENTG